MKLAISSIHFTSVSSRKQPEHLDARADGPSGDVDEPLGGNQGAVEVQPERGGRVVGQVGQGVHSERYGVLHVEVARARVQGHLRRIKV